MNRIKLVFILSPLAIFLGNAVSVSLIGVLGEYTISPRFIHIHRLLEKDLYISIGSFVVPFPIVTLLLLIYIWPVFFNSANNSDYSGVLKRRIINAPVNMSLIGISGWVIGYILFLAIAIWRGYDMPLQYLFENGLQLPVLASITFVISYYVIEFLNRKFAIPELIPDSRLSAINGLQRISIRVRLFVLFLATGFIPSLVFYRILIVLNAGGNNVLKTDISFVLFNLLIFSLITGLIITLLKAYSIQDPILDMVQVSKRITEGKYGDRSQVVSTDEIGRLGEALNDMSAGLAEREKMRDIFGRVVDPTVRDYLISGNLQLGGRRTEATILFTDLEGFTSLSEGTDPQEVVKILNDYFSKMTDCISRHGGMVNKFIGDAILAVFGTPVESQNHATAAVNAAIDMLAIDHEYAPGKRLHTRIGIHTGYVLAGNIGSEQRMEYTVIGDTVNTASRLESACKKMNTNLLISEQTYNSLASNGTDFHSPGKIRLKGKEQPIKVYTVQP